jgi:hypothetical protein
MEIIKENMKLFFGRRHDKLAFENVVDIRVVVFLRDGSGRGGTWELSGEFYPKPSSQA